MAYEIKLDVFEGPLDLLLHLIHKNEVSITDIPIALIARQYLDTIELMRSLNLDVAGEYLVMAAYLTHIKSKMLLPEDPTDEAEDAGEDPRDELVAHLLEYKRYKEAAENLSSLPMMDRDVFVREGAEESAEPAASEVPLNVGLPELLDALGRLIQRTSRRDLLEIEPDRLSVKDKIRELLGRLSEREWITFGSLFDEDYSRDNILTTFLALLEIIRLQLVRAYQDKPFGTILVSRRLPPEGLEDAMPAEGDSPSDSSADR